MPCSQKVVVYLMTCGLCGQKYVGETSRPLVVRYKEHYRSGEEHGLFETLHGMPSCTGTKINHENPEENKWFIGPKNHRRIIHSEVKTGIKQYEQLSVANFLV